MLRRIRIELEHYRSLQEDARRLFLSFMLFMSAYPLLTLFTDAYIWRTSNSLFLVVLLSLARYITLPVGFFVNGKLIGKVKLTKLYGIGMLAFAVSILIVIFIPQITVGSIILAGAIRGAGSGLFWANRNTLVQLLTTKDNRMYYLGLQHSLTLTLDLVIPFVAGWFLVMGERLGIYSVANAYKIAAVAAAVLLFFATTTASKIEKTISNINATFYFNPTKNWTRARLSKFLNGFMNGMMRIIPALAVLIFIGTEETLGTFQSIATGLSTLLVYAIGRKAKGKQRIKVYTVGTVIILLGSVVFSLTFSILGVVVLLVSYILGDAPQWLSINTAILDATDEELEERPDISHYTLVFDREIFLDLGRVVGMLVFLAVLSSSGQAFALRYGPIIVSSALVLAYFPLRALINSLGSKASSPLESEVLES